MVKFLLRCVLLIALPLVLTGCYRADVAIRLEDDGSGALIVLGAFDDQLLARAQQGGPRVQNPLDRLSRLDASQLPPGAEVVAYKQDGYSGARVTVPFKSGDDIGKALDATFAGMAQGAGPTTGSAGAAGPLRGVVLQRDGGGWRFESTIDRLVPTGRDGVDPKAARQLMGDASFTVRLRLPGDVVETNADERGADGELIWKIDVLGARRTLSARTQEPGFAATNAIALAGAALGAALLLVGAGVWMTRRRPTDSGEPTTSEAGPG